MPFTPICPFYSLAHATEFLSLPDDSLEAVLEPFDGLITLDLVVGANRGLAAATLGNTLTRTGHAGVEIHSVNSNSWVVLDTEIDVFADTEAKVTSLGEVTLAELVFLDLQSTLENFLSLWSTDSDVHSDLLVTTDTEGSDSVAGLAVDWGLTTQLFQHLRSTSKSISRLSNRDVEDDLLDAQLLHGVLLLSGFCHFE